MAVHRARVRVLEWLLVLLPSGRCDRPDIGGWTFVTNGQEPGVHTVESDY
ncbi:MAG: hypothetical protein V1862_09355 [Methanobacteriota archaeon]